MNQDVIAVNDIPTNTVEALRRSIMERLVYSVGKDVQTATQRDWMFAVFHAVRDRIVKRWRETLLQARAQNAKRVYYLSMEYLTGRVLVNALLATDLYDAVKQACTQLGADFDALIEVEPDPALGNGGLGRLAACFMDSIATIGLPGIGYGIRYEYGMFSQRIVNGRQIEEPDYWLVNGNPWEFMRPELCYTVRFGGRLTTDEDDVVHWVDTEEVIAAAYDNGVPGYELGSVATMRLWSARASSAINLEAFNRGDYMQAVEEKNRSENVTRVLYPEDSSEHGKELRLRQEYFFVSASMQDIVRRYLRNHGNFDALPDKVAIHLNDTHPALAIPELMRLLIDEHRLHWDDAWSLCTRIFSYTNHTLMSEALETWSVDIVGRLLPRHLSIIFDINARWLASVHARFPDDPGLLQRISLIDEGGERRVRMAYLSVLASHKVNGVSRLHSELIVRTIFSDFARVFPERFCNKTNGITPRRWLAQANPPLAALVDSRIGPLWRRQLDQLGQLRPLAEEDEFRSAFRLAKQQNKQRLVKYVAEHLHGPRLDAQSLFDVQVKRMHEYKRQLLNVLHVVTRYHQILDQPHANWVPRTVFFGGKAASAYHMAKLVIHLINDVARVVNADPVVGNRLKVVFLPDYRVSLAEIVIPAADLSEQISTAGTEASGTGNMKFALNGALTIGTWDGANIEIAGEVGLDNIFIFGKRTEEVQHLRAGYQPRSYYENNFDLKYAIDRLANGAFSRDEPGRYADLVRNLLESDHYLLLADYADYMAAQGRVDERYRDPMDWTRRCVLNVAGMGMFSSDRTIQEYASEIWGVVPLAFRSSQAG